MKLFDQIIGYEETKKELLQIADIIHHPDIYFPLGAKIPKGLLLHGNPGLGKTLMAKALMEEMKRKEYVLRRNSPDGEFVKGIKATFDAAKTHAPSVILLDDLDHYPVNEKSSEEYTVVQACIDEIGDHDIFVIATANKLDDIPKSLQRAGRFDRTIGIKAPKNSDSVRIIEHYMQDKSFVSEVHSQDIAKLLVGKSCAELEMILNEAAIHAGYERSGNISMDHIVQAHLRDKYKDGMEDPEDTYSEEELQQNLKIVAYHEAGHILIGEVLLPGCMAFAYLKHGDWSFVQRCRAMLTDEQSILVHLGGIAAEEVQFGYRTCGSHSDINKALNELHNCIVNEGLFGIQYSDVAFFRRSDALFDMQERIVHHEFDRHLTQAKRIIAENRNLLVAIAEKLLEKKMLVYSDIQMLCTNRRHMIKST